MKPVYYSLILVALIACTATKKIMTPQHTGIATAGKLFTSVYQQRAAEYHALCLQAYNLAHMRVDEALQLPSSKPRAIVTDIDETVLDNSAYDVHQALQGKDYETSTWNEWTAKAEADTVPGALSFLKYAVSKNMEIFYITNRDEKDREGTLRNLQRFGFPNADNAHLLLKQNTSGKETRRQQVAARHEIVLLVGDNLSDFSLLFDKKSTEDRLQAAQQQANQFGNRFIILPNPVYGDWEAALYLYNYQFTAAQKDSAIRKWLKSY